MPILTCPCEHNAAMQAIVRNGVELDICTRCKGVWLDRGELEKLLAAAREADAEDTRERARFEEDRRSFYQDPDAYRRAHPKPDYGGERGEQGERGEYGEGYGGRRKRRGFELFDFFD